MGKAPHRQHRVRRNEDIVSENTIPKIHVDNLYLNEEYERAQNNVCVLMYGEMRINQYARCRWAGKDGKDAIGPSYY